jgi:hypothetical protein
MIHIISIKAFDETTSSSNSLNNKAKWVNSSTSTGYTVSILNLLMEFPDVVFHISSSKSCTAYPAGFLVINDTEKVAIQDLSTILTNFESRMTDFSKNQRKVKLGILI